MSVIQLQLQVLQTSCTIRNPEIRGLKKYQYYCGGSLLKLEYNGPQHPILIIKAPIVSPKPLAGCSVYESHHKNVKGHGIASTRPSRYVMGIPLLHPL